MRVSAIDITMAEVEKFMTALSQDFNPSEGKGSHRKVTLNGAQIADIRDRFIEYYLFPAHLKEVLIESGKLPF